MHLYMEEDLFDVEIQSDGNFSSVVTKEIRIKDKSGGSGGCPKSTPIGPMTTLSWNCQGLANPSASKCLFETKMKLKKVEKIKRRLHFGSLFLFGPNRPVLGYL